MRVRLLSLALIGAAWVVSTVAECPRASAQSTKPTPVSQAGSSDTTRQEKLPGTRAGNTEDANRKTQAVLVLHQAIESTEQIGDLESQTNILSNALDLLWKPEEPYARSNFIKALDRLLTEYSSTKDRDHVASSIRILLSHLAKHDAAAAAAELEQYEKVISASGINRGKLSLKDQVTVADATLDVDYKQSAALAARMLNQGVSIGFPDYLYQLETKDEALASNLYGAALSQLAANPIYSPTYATILSANAFREKLLVLEVRTNSRNSPHIEFGSVTINLSPSNNVVNIGLATAYLTAAYSFLGQRLVILQGQPDIDQEYVIQCYFLARKLSAYAQALNIVRDDRWPQMSAQFEILGHRAGISIEELDNISRLAQRLAAEGTIIRFDDGASAFQKAKVSKDAKEKTELLVRGIHELVEAGRFSEAERRITELTDENLIAQITDYLNFRAGRAAVARRKWNDLSAYLTKIVDPRLRTYVLLEGIDAAFKYKKKNLASDYLQFVVTVASTIDDKSDRAKALVAINGVVGPMQSEWSSQALLDAIAAVNRANEYDGGDYSVTIELPKLKLYFPLKDSNIETSFERSARRDWVGVISATNTISRVQIRALAQIAACRAIL